MSNTHLIELGDLDDAELVAQAEEVIDARMHHREVDEARLTALLIIMAGRLRHPPRLEMVVKGPGRFNHGNVITWKKEGEKK